MAETNAQVALLAAAQVHQKVAAGTGGGGSSYSGGNVKVDRSYDTEVLGTATAFLRFLRENS